MRPGGPNGGMRLADEIGQVSVLILVGAMGKGAAAMGSVIPAVQNLLLAARTFGIGGTITTLHPQGRFWPKGGQVIQDLVQDERRWARWSYASACIVVLILMMMAKPL